jgi:hypothetical protein
MNERPARAVTLVLTAVVVLGVFLAWFVIGPVIRDVYAGIVVGVLR